jgi:hypothetical protein
MGGLWQWTLGLFGKRKAGPNDINLPRKESEAKSQEERPKVVLEVPGMN